MTNDYAFEAGICLSLKFEHNNGICYFSNRGITYYNGHDYLLFCSLTRRYWINSYIWRPVNAYLYAGFNLAQIFQVLIAYIDFTS